MRCEILVIDKREKKVSVKYIVDIKKIFSGWKTNKQKVHAWVWQ